MYLCKLGKEMRRILWNIYAWPMTLLIVATFVPIAGRASPLSALNVMVSIPSLVALHLHIWDKRFLSARFWKPYALAFVVWELAYNIVLEPMETGDLFEPILFVVAVVLLPLYVAVFRYAFRRWAKDELPN